MSPSPISLDQIREFLLAHSADGSVTAIDDDESLLEAGVIDSAGMLDLIAFLEKTFGFTVDEDDMIPENFDSVTAIGAYAQSKSDAAS